MGFGPLALHAAVLDSRGGALAALLGHSMAEPAVEHGVVLLLWRLKAHKGCTVKSAWEPCKRCIQAAAGGS